MPDELVLQAITRINEKEEFDEDDINEIIEFSKHDDAIIRSFAAELLEMSCCEASKNTLMKLLYDESKLVRADACNALCMYEEEIVLNALLEVAHDDVDEIVRSYSTLSAGDILVAMNCDSKNSYFRNLLRSEEHPMVQAAIYATLYRLGDQTYFESLLSGMQTLDYKIKHFIINMLRQIANKNNADEIMSAIAKQRKFETNIPTLSTIDDCLEYMGKKYCSNNAK